MICQSRYSRETKVIRIYVNTQLFSEELAHLMVGAGKSEGCQAGQQTGSSGMSSFCSLEVEFLLLWETSVFVLKMLYRLDEAHPYYQR